MKAIKLHEPREKVKDEVILESVYEETGVDRLNEFLDDQERIEAKGLISIFGYKHSKSMKFYGQLLRCLRACYECKYDQLNIDMNFFLLLKNELSLAFLRNTDNLVSAVKSAVRIYAAEDENERKGEEACEIKILERILENQEQVHDSDSDEETKSEKNDFSPDAHEEAKQAMFEKIINKLLEYNEKINSGKEIILFLINRNRGRIC